MEREISFNEILNLFDSKIWHIGYLTHEDLEYLINSPIKTGITCNGDSQNNIIFKKNSMGILFIKHTLDYDYSVDEEVPEKLSLIKDLKFIAPIDNLPLKPAQILAGTGQYGKNQVIYDEIFGFDTHIGLAIVYNIIIDLPQRKKPNWNFLPQCNDCMDCYNACPVKAIHNQETPMWVNMSLCQDFNNFGNDEKIPSMKWGWGKFISKPPIPDEILLNIKGSEDFFKLFHTVTFPHKITYKGKTRSIQYPVCRECCSQPKCSKWNGQYPYDKNRVKIYGVNYEEYIEKQI